MARFLNKVDIKGDVASPVFVNPNIRTGEIKDAYEPSTGNKLVDMALNTATKMVEKMEGARRKNEVASAEIQARNNMLELDSRWAGLDIYSDDLHGKYLKDLEEVNAQNRTLLQDSRFTKKEDIDAWSIRNDKAEADAKYFHQGKKNEYDIKEITDTTILNAKGLIEASAYAGSKEESERLTIEGLSLYDNLKTFMPESKILELKAGFVANQAKMRLENQLQDIVNSGASFEDKQAALNTFRANAGSPEAYRESISRIAKKSGLDGEQVDIIANNTRAYVEQMTNKADGIYQSLSEQIKAQEYRFRQEYESTQEKLKRDYINGLNSTDSNVRSGNYIIAISNVEEMPMTPDSFMNDPVIVEKYFDNNLADIVKSGEYVQVYSTTETSRMRQEMEANEQSGATRAESIQTVVEEINGYGTIVEQDNVRRSLVARKLVSQAEIELYNSGDMGALNNMYRGSKSRDAKNLVYSQMATGNPIRDITSQLTPYQQDIVSQIMVGKIMNNELGWSGQVKINARTFDTEYRKGGKFAREFNLAVETAKRIQPQKITERKVKKEKFKEVLDKKYSVDSIRLKEDTGINEYNVPRKTYTEEVWD